MKQRGPQRPTPPLAPPEFERLPSPALQPISAPTTWGTRQRIAEHLSKLDQESLDHLLDKVMRTGNAPSFIAKFHPQPGWLWRQWRGTVLQQCWVPACSVMLVCIGLIIVMETVRLEGEHQWMIVEVPHESDSWVKRFRGFTTMWGYLLTMATFVNSFFLSQTYSFWVATKGNARKVQGRLNDLGMLLATHAARDAQGNFTPASHELLATVGGWVRLYHVLFWAGQVRPARADEGLSLSVFRTEIGLEALEKRGALTEREHELLLRHASHRHSAVLEWIVTRFVDAHRAGLLQGSAGLESRFLEEACKLRASSGCIGDDAAARMPLAYIHLVQLLVDCLLSFAPFALYPKLGVLTALLCPVLVIFYRGFLQLSKSLLDPFGNEDSLAENFNVFTLICETNAASFRWYGMLEELPFTPASAPQKNGSIFGG